MVTHTIHDLKPIIVDQNLDGSEVIYTVGPRNDGQIGDVTTVNPVMLGTEFPHTYGHYHVPPHNETYMVQSGQGTVLVQKMDLSGQLEDFKRVDLQSGESYTVPAGYWHQLINTGPAVLVALDDWNPAWAQHTYDDVTHHHGFAYYLVKGAEGSGPALLKNTNY